MKFYRNTLLAVCAIFLSLNTVGQALIFPWEASYRLRYEDFMGGVPFNQRKVQAITSAVIEVKYEQAGNELNVRIITYFKRSDSWMRNESKNEYTLNHEQGHFDITEIFSRKLRKQLTGSSVTPRNASKKIMGAWKKMNKKHMKMQYRYDKATSYSVREKNQKQWIQRIAAELKELESFKEPTVKVKIKS